MKHFYSLCTIAVMKKLFKFLTCTVLIAYALISCDKDDGIPPTAAFTASETEITEGQRIDFIDESLNIPAQWNWDFGDGGSSTSQHPSYGYSTPEFILSPLPFQMQAVLIPRKKLITLLLIN